MFNLIKMDLYRLFHSLSTWVMLLAMVGVAFFCVAMTNDDLTAMQNDPAYMEQSLQIDNDTPHAGIIMETDPAWINGEIPAEDLIVLLINSAILLLCITVFVSIFVHAEQKNGYIKNIAGQLPFRGLLAVSRLISIAVGIFLIFVVYLAATFAVAYLFWGDRLVADSITTLWKILGTQYLLHLAFGSLVMFLCIAARNNIVSLCVGILMACGIMNFVYTGISQVIHAAGWKTFELGKYMLETNVCQISGSTSTETFLRALISGGVFLVLTVIGSAWIMQKRDIR